MITATHLGQNVIFVGIAVLSVINSTNKINATRSLRAATRVGIEKFCLRANIPNAILDNGYLIKYTRTLLLLHTMQKASTATLL